MENDNSKSDNFEQLMASYTRRAAERRLTDYMSANYTRLRRRWMLRAGIMLTLAVAAVGAVSAAAMPAPDYGYLRGSNAAVPQLAITDINATLAAL